jgi:hypothetical protein
MSLRTAIGGGGRTMVRPQQLLRHWISFGFASGDSAWRVAGGSFPLPPSQNRM